VLAEIRGLQREFRTAVILVTHDLGVVAETCARAIVMYCGSVVESGPTAELFRYPRHPYTRGLLDSVPRIRAERLPELPVIPGRVPDPGSLPAGCRFADRCSRVQARCRVERPPLVPAGAGSPGSVACFNPW
jgi:oligopeptide/dipeptide ABC transporter ATP-binding protein